MGRLHNAWFECETDQGPLEGSPPFNLGIFTTRWKICNILSIFFRDSVKSVKLCFLSIPKKSIHYSLDNKTLLTRAPGEPVGLHSETDAVPNISSYFMSQMCNCSGHNHICVMVVQYHTSTGIAWIYYEVALV
jgi:hypothetical protein